jgi:cobalamin biosynthesis protein CobW
MTGRESHHDLEGEEHDHDDFVSFVMALAPAASLVALKAKVIATLAIPGVLRVKGRVAVAGKSAPAVVQAVGPRVEASFAPGGAASGLVVIGLRTLDRAAVAVALGG